MFLPIYSFLDVITHTHPTHTHMREEPNIQICSCVFNLPCTPTVEIHKIRMALSKSGMLD